MTHETPLQTVRQLERRVRLMLRAVDAEALGQAERRAVTKIEQACNEIRLDIRDYEYADTREEQLKWAKIARHNLHALNTLLLSLGEVFGAADMAELGAYIETLRNSLE